MPMTYADKYEVLKKLCGLREKKAFSAAFPNGINQKWKTRPQPAKHIIIADVLNKHRPENLINVDFGEILDDDNLAMLDFMSKLNISWIDMEGIVSDGAKNDWRHSVPFLQSLETFSSRTSEETLGNFYGSFFLYRKHSILPGILKEVIDITDIGRGRNSGLYKQYKIDADYTGPIEISAFHGGSYLFIAGSLTRHHDELNEIISMYISLDPNIKSQQIFSGILTGIYDSEQTILSERILLRRTDDQNPEPTRLHPEMDWSEEYRIVSDMIDNSLDGQTFSLRRSRLEWLPKSGNWSVTGEQAASSENFQISGAPR